MFEHEGHFLYYRFIEDNRYMFRQFRYLTSNMELE